LTGGRGVPEGSIVNKARAVVLAVVLVRGLAGCASSGRDPAAFEAVRAPDGHLRLVAGNLTSGNKQAYEAPGIRILQGIAPDVAMLQEFNYKTNSAADLRSFVDAAFGGEFAYVRGAPAQIPNGIVSRYPIIASGEWVDSQVSNRDFVWAQIDIPGPVDLVAISVHLLTANASVRNLEAGQLVQRISALPAGAYVALGGDFNTASRGEAGIQTLSSVLVTAGPWPVDQDGVGNTNAARAKPFDWVLVNPALDALEAPVDVGTHTFPDGLVVDTRVYAPMAELAPALAGDSGAASMQHMAVVRDFAVEGEPPPPPASVAVTAPNGGETWVIGSSQTVAWTASEVSAVDVALSTDGATWTPLASGVAAADGQVAVIVPAGAPGAARIRVSAAPGGSPSDESDAAFAIVSAGPPPAPRVFINEVLANEPGSDTAGEFVELVNSGNAAADLSGWKISDAAAVRHTFAAGTALAAGRAIVVYAGASAIPAGLGNAIAASTGSLVLGNSGDTVTLAGPSGTVDSVTYTSALSGSDGVSMNRSPDGDPAGGFVLHSQLSASPRSPGVRATGAAF
jgi:endonuclease/exonuclease/phosphatase family metal-dependent hydrolase